MIPAVFAGIVIEESPAPALLPLFEAASSFAEGKVSPPLSASVGGRKKSQQAFPFKNTGCALAGGLAERVLATVLL